MKASLIKLWHNNKSLLLFISLMMVFRSAVADWSDVPTGSMKPTIMEGDRIFVNKMAYDIRVPFSHISLYEMSNPKANDIIIFDSEVADKRLVKRVIGVPGDKVSLSNNQLTINDVPLQYQLDKAFDDKTYQIETSLADKRRVTITRNSNFITSFSAVIVPPEHYLVLGDNRDNSADSRVIGFVPRHEIVGRSSHVVLSLDYDNYFLPRAERFFNRLF